MGFTFCFLVFEFNGSILFIVQFDVEKMGRQQIKKFAFPFPRRRHRIDWAFISRCRNVSSIKHDNSRICFICFIYCLQGFKKEKERQRTFHNLFAVIYFLDSQRHRYSSSKFLAIIPVDYLFDFDIFVHSYLIQGSEKIRKLIWQKEQNLKLCGIF